MLCYSNYVRRVFTDISGNDMQAKVFPLVWVYNTTYTCIIEHTLGDRKFLPDSKFPVVPNTR